MKQGDVHKTGFTSLGVGRKLINTSSLPLCRCRGRRSSSGSTRARATCSLPSRCAKKLAEVCVGSVSRKDDLTLTPTPCLNATGHDSHQREGYLCRHAKHGLRAWVVLAAVSANLAAGGGTLSQALRRRATPPTVCDEEMGCRRERIRGGRRRRSKATITQPHW